MSDTQPNDLPGAQPEDPAAAQADDLTSTQPSELSGTPASAPSDTQPRKKMRFAPSVFWISVLILVAALLLGGASGYGTGIAWRESAQATLTGKTLGDQFTLAQQDFANGNYDVVRQRLEYILKEDPNYPGAASMLTKVIVELAITPTLTLTPTPSITPTPDLRNQEAIYAQVQQGMQAKDWTSVLGSLDALRKSDPNYKTAQVDSMYYSALRNRGVDQILGNGPYAQTTNLEGGIYDLTLAERFGPLDSTAAGLRNFAREYITGASFWDLDWAQARDYFAQVYQQTPNLRDSSNLTATMRYSQALLKYGDQLASASRLKDRCPALAQWEQANTVIPLDATYAQKFADLNLLCNPPTATPPPTDIPAEPTVTPTP
jgi:hypothetical protein